MSTPSLPEDILIYEDKHVHEVYDQIASHFSATRYKPWPIVEQFLRDIATGSVGLDVGCGNGKYLTVNPNIFIIASDRSLPLVHIASKHQPHSAVLADTLSLPHPIGQFDFAISIAVIHHLSTSARRIAAIKEILDILQPLEPPLEDRRVPAAGLQSSEPRHGKALIYVWALEQQNSRRGWSEANDQDVMVPWVLKSDSRHGIPNRQNETRSNDDKDVTLNGDRVLQRYYHLFRAGELEQNIREAGGLVLDSGYERDNWWAIVARVMPSS
ncbi:MAG: hypothetical protein M1825_001868 [Sarcosagium campestre]|nr:MAG: hypothetical protein M1825_001868 [Sarcosagium campestre]